MNLFFAAIGKNIAAKLPAPSGNATIGADRSDLGNMSLPLLTRIEICSQQIWRKVKELKSNKSSSPDNLSPRLLVITKTTPACWNLL